MDNFYLTLCLDFFDVVSDSRIKLHTSNAHTNVQHPTIICSRVVGDSIWSHYHHMERSLCMCRVTWPIIWGTKMIHIFEIPDPNLSLCHFQGATTNIKPCYRWKLAFIPLWRLQSSLRMCSITWPVHRGSLKTTRNNFLTPNSLFTIQLLWGYDDD